jgi:DNA-directed RNA polymerase
MIVKPKHYSKGELGGYLLNNVKYKEDLIIHKSTIKVVSYVKDDNIIYQMVNNISNVAYKINIDLLDYLTTDKHGLLINLNNPSKYANIPNRTKYQQSKFTSDMSRLNLQEIVLGLADFYKNFSEIYFPLRMDQRGRLYCSTTYLNYQSNELAKSLLLFAKPGIISKKGFRCYKIFRVLSG